MRREIVVRVVIGKLKILIWVLDALTPMQGDP